MVVKKYSYTEWIKGKNFFLEFCNDAIEELVAKHGGIIKEHVANADFLVYAEECAGFSEQYQEADELNKSGKKRIVMLTCKEFMEKIADKEKGTAVECEVGSVICLLKGDHTKCWAQKLQIVYSTLPLEEAKRVFEVYNIAHGEYAKAANGDFDVSYVGLYGLEDEVIEARKKLIDATDIDEKFLQLKDNSYGDDEDYDENVGGEGGIDVNEIIASNPGRYESVKKYFIDEDGDIHFNFKLLPLKIDCYHWINLSRVSEDEYERYASELPHEYFVAELFAPEALPFDIDDLATVSVFGTGKFEALADLSYGC